MTPEPEVTGPATPRVSVVIVSLNRIESLRRSLDALAGPHQVVVVDNGSTDGSAELETRYPNVRFSRLPRNFGLTKALNIGIRAGDGEYILCLHDDTRISSDDVTRLADYLEAHPEVGAVCPLLVDADDRPAPQVRRLPTPAQPDPPLTPAQGESEIAAESVLGAAIMFRAFLYRALRQIDEHYGTYGSDIEICAQVRRASKKLVILAGVGALHESLRSPVDASTLAGDRAVGTAVFLGKHHGFAAGMVYRLKTALAALFTFRFSVLAGVLSGQKIDGVS